MFCENCGTKLGDDLKFCTCCGKKLDAEPAPVQPAEPQPEPQPAPIPVQPVAPQPAPQPAAPEQGQAAAAPQPQISYKKIIIAALAALAALFIFIIIMVVAVNKLVINKKAKIDLSDYLTVQLVDEDAYDGYGRVTYSFDSEAFIADYGDDLTYTNAFKKTDMYIWAAYYESPAVFFEDIYIGYGSSYGSLDASTGLSNGDEVTFTWNVDCEEMEEYFNCKITCDDYVYTVSGLAAIQEVDAFAEFTVVYSGYAPGATATIINNSSDSFVNCLYYSVDKTTGLSNGDVITVTIDESNLESLAQSFGMKPASLTKEYVVDGLSSYYTSLGDIPAELIYAAVSQGEDVLRAYAANNWSDYATLSDLSYLGAYYFVPKDDRTYSSSDCGTKLCLVYKVTSHEVSDYADQYFSYYWSIWFYDPVDLADGSWTIDLTNYEYSSNSITNEIAYYHSWTKTLTYKGYYDLDTLFEKCVYANVEYYTYESSVNEANSTVVEVTSGEEETSEEADSEGEDEAIE